MHTILHSLFLTGVVPVVVIHNAEDAIPAARALLAGGVNVMEITLRTEAGLDSIRAVASACPDMIVGAGTVLNVEQAQKCVEAGARFIVSPGFNAKQVAWCVENGVAVTPGCVTPSEIMAAMEYGLEVLKFFPSNVYGGLSAMKALSGPFGGLRFIPTGGIDGQNAADYCAAPFIHAVGGSWLCAAADISAGNFEKITALCQEARKAILGFEVAHVGINTANAEASGAIAAHFAGAFGFNVKAGSSSNFASSGIEIMKSPYLGRNGHIAVRTNSIPRALAHLEQRGYAADMDTAKYKGNVITAIYLKEQMGDFAIHLLQR